MTDHENADGAPGRQPRRRVNVLRVVIHRESIEATFSEATLRNMATFGEVTSEMVAEPTKSWVAGFAKRLRAAMDAGARSQSPQGALVMVRLQWQDMATLTTLARKIVTRARPGSPLLASAVYVLLVRRVLDAVPEAARCLDAASVDVERHITAASRSPLTVELRDPDDLGVSP